MAEMQQSTAPTAAPAQAPATPATPGTPAGQLAPTNPAPTTNQDLSQYSVNQLRGILARLKDERQELANRRQNTEGTYERATGVSQQGIGERIRVLDANIISYENEIARVGREYALRGGGSIAEARPQGIPPGYMAEDEAAGMAFGFSFMTLILAVYFTRRVMRRRYARVPAMPQPNMIGSSERLDRIEQAVDTIAVEIERVSENQRFMTRLMTETQLGDTIKDVRKSAELAKSAAMPGSGE